MASCGSEYSSSDVGELRVAGRPPAFRGGDSGSDSDDPNMTLLIDREVGVFGTGVVAAGGRGDAIFGQRLEERDLPMSARTGSLSELRLASDDVGTIGEAASPEVEAVFFIFKVPDALTFARLVGMDGVRDDCRRGRLPITETGVLLPDVNLSGAPEDTPAAGPDTFKGLVSWDGLDGRAALLSKGSSEKSE